MVTCGTYLKQHYLNTSNRLSFVQSSLFAVAKEFQWGLQAWAVLSNHYHFVAFSPETPESLSIMLSKLHTMVSVERNRQDHKIGRRVWYQYYDSHITYQTSFFARLKYVHQNPVHHGLVKNAENYPWCSASWFVGMASSSFYRTIQSFITDRLNVRDDFDVVAVEDVLESGVKPPHSEGALPRATPPHIQE